MDQRGGRRGSLCRQAGRCQGAPGLLFHSIWHTPVQPGGPTSSRVTMLFFVSLSKKTIRIEELFLQGEVGVTQELRIQRPTEDFAGDEHDL